MGMVQSAPFTVAHELRSILDAATDGETDRLLRMAGTPLPTRFRFNSLKHSPEFQSSLLDQEGVRFRALSWPPGVFEITDSSVRIGKSLAHFLGDLYIQDLSSMLPVPALAVTPGQRILDLCAAPGSKTTQLAEALQDRGIIVANDTSGRRAQSLMFNLRRMGASCVAVMKRFGEEYGNYYFEQFDGVLLDAPCSALGTLHKSPEVLRWWTPRRTEKLATNQRSLLLSAIKATRPGGAIVYSTCTLAPQENELILDWALQQFPVELEPLPFPNSLRVRQGLTSFEQARLHPMLQHAARILPHENESEGFFIARLRKVGSFSKARFRRPPGDPVNPLLSRDHPTVRAGIESFGRAFLIPEEALPDSLFTVTSDISIASKRFSGFPFHTLPLQIGLPIAHLSDGQAQITTEGSHLLGSRANSRVYELSSWEEIFAFANRDDLNSEGNSSGQHIARFRGQPIGHGWVDRGLLLSRFPRAGWRFGGPGGN